MEEQWKDVKGYIGLYMISNLGRVKSLERSFKRNNGRVQSVIEKIMRLPSDKDGYQRVGLSKDSKRKMFIVHRLIAEAFIANPENKPQVNHIDGDKTNNNLSNLEWCTMSENRQHAFDIGLQHNRGEKNASHKLMEYQIKEIRYSDLSVKELTIKYNVNDMSIRNILKRRTWKHI